MDSVLLVCTGALELPVSQQFSSASRKQMEDPATHHLCFHTGEERKTERGGSRAGIASWLTGVAD